MLTDAALIETDDVRTSGYAWRIADQIEEWVQEQENGRITMYSGASAQKINAAAAKFRANGLPRLRYEEFRATSLQSLECDEPSVRLWLSRLPLSAAGTVFCSWGTEYAAAVTWDLFEARWESLWYPFDVLNVFDREGQQALLMGPEECAAYVMPGPARVIHKHIDERALCLVRAAPP
jgi:hypothetical protein